MSYTFVTCMDYSNIDYTFESKASYTKSVLDHFFITNNIAANVFDVSVCHEGDNLSDHSPVTLQFNYVHNIEYINLENQACLKNDSVSWNNATPDMLNAYKCVLDCKLQNLKMPLDALRCKSVNCTHHSADMIEFHDNIINACINSACETLPAKRSRSCKNTVPGWTQYVEHARETSMLWHDIWKCNGCPREGHVANIRRSTRAKYHYAVKFVKQNEQLLRNNKLAKSLTDNNSGQFWSVVRNINNMKRQLPNVVDSKCTESDISNIFADKYKTLYNSVNYDQNEMSKLIKTLDEEVINKCCDNNCVNHEINVCDVIYCVDKLKSGKHDGVTGFYSDNIKHGSHKLFVYLSLLFNAMILHCAVPDRMFLSTLVPLIKNKRRSSSSSDNYRAIALSSSLGKLLDNIVLYKFDNVLHASDLQFGFKKGHSTTMCTFAVNEVIQYYINQNTPVYLTLLDASKAFDCVHYVKMFNILRKKGLCPLYCKFLVLLYTNQSAQVKWNKTLSNVFKVTNGVKQGGVLSPILFTAYMEELLIKLKSTNVGCHIGHTYCGSFGYADDIALLNPSVHATNIMLQVCNSFSKDYNITFNAEKTKLLLFNSCNNKKPVIIFNNSPIVVSICEKHLGTYVGDGSNNLNIL